MRATLVRSLSVLAVLSWTVAPAAAQRGWDPLGPPQKQGAAPANAPTRVIVRALAGTGEPVTDLKAEELSIKVDGKDRKVENLELVTIAAGGPPAAAAPAAAKPASTLPAPFATNTAPEPAAVPTGGREFLIILDEEGIGPGREEPVRKAIAQLTASAAPSDRFGLISLRQGGVDIQASAPAVLTDALTKFVGGGSQSESLGDLTCRTKRALSTLGNALRASSVGRTILLVTPGLPASPSGVLQIRQGTGDAGNSSFSDACQIRSNDFDELSAAATSSPANVYVLHYVDGMANTANVRDAQQGIENIAGTINGEVVRISGGSDASLDRVMSETSSYYIATLDPAPAAAIRRIDARSTRTGVKLLVRPAGRVRGGTATAAGPAPRAGSPRDMIRVPTVFRELPLRATGLVSRVPGKTDMMVMALFEPEDPATKLNAAIVALYDEKGTLKAQWTAQPKELDVTPVAAAVPVAPGSYRMRVAATDDSGRGGTTDTNIVVQLKDAGPVKLGSLVMGTDQKSPKLQFTGSDPQVIGFVPIYGVTKDMKISVVYEVRESESGAPMGSIPGNLLEMPGAPDTRMVWAGFGLPPLAPGDYQLKVIVTVDGQEAGAVTRTLRKVQ